MDRVYLVGDSWVAGLAGRLLERRLRDLGYEVYRDGVVGRTSRALAEDLGFQRRLQEFAPDIVLFVLGVNDTPGPVLRHRYAVLYAFAKHSGARHIFIQPNSQAHEPYVERIRKVAEFQRDIFGDAQLPFENLVNQRHFDGSKYHLNRTGAAHWVDLVLRSLLQRIQPDLLDRVGDAFLRVLPRVQ